MDYIRQVLEPRVTQHVDEDGSIMPTLLLMDAFGAHVTEPVKAELARLKIDVLVIPSELFSLLTDLLTDLFNIL